MEASILELGHAAALVELADGKRATLPWKEVWTAFKIHDRAEDYLVVEQQHEGSTIVRAVAEHDPVAEPVSRVIRAGDRLHVVSLGHDFAKGRHPIVSHVRVYGDPWDAVSDWRDHELKFYTVESVTDLWAWGTVSPGITARAKLAGFAEFLPGDDWRGQRTPVRGDEIGGWYLASETDHDKQVIVLDYTGYVKSPVELGDFFEVPEAEAMPDVTAPSNSLELVSDLAARAKIRTILLVDDDEELCASLGEYLRQDCNVRVLDSLDEAGAYSFIDGAGCYSAS